ncbi:MAG: DUF4271 domain-containing protein [Flavobacteriales bacterium]|jgi:hypothetical protein|nr:DUF4271 domain-containing protein [Flavobacteriales bacterium]
MPLDALRTVDPYKAEWVTLLFVAILAALAWTNISSPRKWRLLAQAAFRMRLGKQVLREEAVLRDRTFIGLLLVAVAVVALFLWQAAGGEHGLAAYGMLAGTIVLALAAHIIGVQFTGWLFQGDGGLHEHLATGLLLFILTAIVLLPITLLGAYRAEWRPALVLVGTVAVLALLAYRWLRGMAIGVGERVPLPCIILYLCAAEAVPLAFLWTGLLEPHSARPHP